MAIHVPTPSPGTMPGLVLKPRQGLQESTVGIPEWDIRVIFAVARWTIADEPPEAALDRTPLSGGLTLEHRLHAREIGRRAAAHLPPEAIDVITRHFANALLRIARERLQQSLATTAADPKRR